MRRNSIIAAFAASLIALPVLAQTPVSTSAASQADAIARLPILGAQRPPAVINLSAGDYQTQRNTLQIRRTLSVANVRANPTTTIGSTQVNFRPMLDNPQALVNVSQRMRAMPQLIDVRGETLEIVEVPQGLVVYNQLTYALRVGSCRDDRRRAAVAGAGARCFTRSDERTQDAAFANRNDPRFVADATLRETAIRRARQQRIEVQRDINDGLSRFRAGVGTASGRAAFISAIGSEETQRLQALDDEALAGEIANTAETTVTEAFFIPADGATTATASPAPPAGVQAQVPSRYDIGTHYYIAGFTLGRKYVWSQKVKTTVNWCLVACEKTYSVEAGVEFSYGFGLRVPIELTGAYTFDPATNSAELRPTIRTIDANERQYSAAQMPDDQMFSGKELVAEIGAGAWAKAVLPIYGTLRGRFDIGLDLTNLLTGTALAGGNFKPPMPNDGGVDITRVFDSLDLLGNYGSFGIVGVRVYPALTTTLTSKLLTLDLRDPSTGSSVVHMSSGGTYRLAVNPTDNSSRFSIENPLYDLTFTLTPGINARAYVDLAVWSAQWDFPVWFPALSVALPANGVRFACHARTTCSRNFSYSPAGGTSMGNTRDGLDVDLADWGRSFTNEWKATCTDGQCRTVIDVLRLSYDTRAKEQYDARLAENAAAAQARAPGAPPNAPLPRITFASLSWMFAEAATKARTEVNLSLARRTVSQTEPMIQPFIASWKSKCSDEPCTRGMDNAVGAIRTRIRQLAEAEPQSAPQVIFNRVQGEFESSLQQTITASDQRAAVIREMAKDDFRIAPPQQTQPPRSPITGPQTLPIRPAAPINPPPPRAQ